MKLSLTVLLVCISVSQAFSPWGVFQKWKGEVEESLDSKENNEHAERFMKEVQDKKIELLKKHEERGNDVMNKVHKVWKNKGTEEPEIDPTAPFEPEIKPTDPEVIPTEPEIEPTENYVEPTEDYVELTEKYVEPTEDYVEPTQEYVEPTEDYVEPTQEYVETTEQWKNYVEPTQEYIEPIENEIDPEFGQSNPEAPDVPPTDEHEEVDPTEVTPEQPTEELELIEVPIEGNDSEEQEREEDDGPDFFKDSDKDDDDENESVEEEKSPVEMPNKEDEIKAEDFDVAPKESWEDLNEEPNNNRWLKKRQHKLKKLWRKFTDKHSEKVLNKIRKLEEKMAYKREE